MKTSINIHTTLPSESFCHTPHSQPLHSLHKFSTNSFLLASYLNVLHIPAYMYSAWPVFHHLFQNGFIMFLLHVILLPHTLQMETVKWWQLNFEKLCPGMCQNIWWPILADILWCMTDGTHLFMSLIAMGIIIIPKDWKVFSKSAVNYVKTTKTNNL